MKTNFPPYLEDSQLHHVCAEHGPWISSEVLECPWCAGQKPERKTVDQIDVRRLASEGWRVQMNRNWVKAGGTPREHHKVAEGDHLSGLGGDRGAR